MRNSSLLAAGLLLFLGCQRPSSTVNYSPLENLPPKTAQRAQEGGACHLGSGRRGWEGRVLPSGATEFGP